MMQSSNRFTRRTLAAWCSVALLVVACTSADAAQVTETDDFAKIAVVVKDYAREVGPSRVLLVLDIDNTLLAMDRPLGSDQWFEWQRYLIDHEKKSPYRVADSFPGLLEAQGLLYNRGSMHPPQQDLPEIIRELQEMGVYTLVLTSRGDEFRAATQRELSVNDYDFLESTLPVRDVPRGTYLPYNVRNPGADGLKSKEVKAFRLADPKPISYEDGIMMTAGQAKGAMLLTMLHDAAVEIDAIVFADDNVRHVASVFGAIAGRGEEITAFHYTREDANVNAFRYGSKVAVDRQWRELTKERTEAVVRTTRRPVTISTQRVRTRGCCCCGR